MKGMIYIDLQNNNDILKYVIENGMIDLSYIRGQVEMVEKKELLNSHKYKIWQGTDGKWRTYLPDKERGRKLLKRNNYQRLEDEIIKYYKAHKDDEEHTMRQKNINLFEIFPEWLEYKQIHTNSTSYIKRITADWNKFYKHEIELIQTPLNELTQVYLDNWAHSMIKKYNLTKKCYYNMSIILRQCLEYAVTCEYINNNPFQNVAINSKMFKRTKKKKGESQVYSVEEEKLLIEDMIRRFNADPTNTAPLAVILAFETGVRIGELCALEKEDIEGNYIHIQRQEVREFEKVDSYSMKFKRFKIVEYAKSDDGFRDIYLTKTARKILDIVFCANETNHEKTKEGFIFVKNGKNITHYSIQAMILRGCQRIGIPVKTSHKIRKTYISTLIDSGLNIDQIRRMAGHSDERTTYGNYCYNRLSDEETENVIENALNSEKVIKGNHFSKIIDFQENRTNTAFRRAL